MHCHRNEESLPSVSISDFMLVMYFPLVVRLDDQTSQESDSFKVT